MFFGKKPNPDPDSEFPPTSPATELMYGNSGFGHTVQAMDPVIHDNDRPRMAGKDSIEPQGTIVRADRPVWWLIGGLALALVLGFIAQVVYTRHASKVFAQTASSGRCAERTMADPDRETGKMIRYTTTSCR